MNGRTATLTKPLQRRETAAAARISTWMLMNLILRRHSARKRESAA